MKTYSRDNKRRDRNEETPEDGEQIVMGRTYRENE